MDKMRIIFFLGGIALIIVGAINNNAVWVVGLSLIILSLLVGAITKKNNGE